MIDGVQLIPLTTHTDERGFFREVLRVTDEGFTFGQWSHSSSYTGTIKAWHVHRFQTDYFYVPTGVIKVVLIDLRKFDKLLGWIFGKDKIIWAEKQLWPEAYEYLLGDNQPAQVLCIPPGVAHGLKVLQGPAHLFYVTSHVYNPDDEGRIPFDALGYDWHKVEIK